MKRFCFVFMAVLLLSCEGERELPDIVLISVDDMGWSDLGCYGSEISTPNIDRLAREGMRFTSFHNTSKCFPSRACLITGVYAQQNGYSRSFNGALRNSITLGELLREAGYITLWSGKHHGLEIPVTRGFDHYYGLKDGACNHFNPGEQRPGEGRPARKEDHGIKRKRHWCIDSVSYVPYTPEAKDFYTTDYFTRYALEWLDEFRDDARPLFLYMAYTAPHDPLMAWPEDIEKYRGRYDAGYEAIRSERYRRQKEMGLIDERYRLSEATYRSWDSLDLSEQQEEALRMEVYAAMIDRLDQQLGLLFEKLESSGRLENTLVMLVSDNGASAEQVSLDDDYGPIGSLTRWSSLGPDWANVCNTPFRYYKNYSFEGGINTPLIAWWPGRIKAGSKSDFPGHFIDIMPTLAELSGAAYPLTHHGESITPMQGQSLVAVMQGEKVERQGPLFWEWRRGQAVREDSWKLVREGLDQDWSLYDMDQDPTETQDLAAQYPAKVDSLTYLFTSWLSSTENRELRTKN